MPKEYRLPNQVNRLLKRCLLHAFVLVAVWMALFGPWRNRIIDWLPYLEKHGTELFVVFIFIWSVQLLRFIRRGAISAIALQDHAVRLTYSGYFSDEPITERTLEAKDIYYIGRRGFNLALVTSEGRVELGASAVVNEFLRDLQNAFLLNKMHYQSLDKSRLYDIFQALPAGAQAELVGEVINEKTEAEALERQREYFTESEESESFVQVGNVYKPRRLKALPELSVSVCPRCASESMLSGELRHVHAVPLELDDAKAKGIRQRLANTLPLLDTRIRACLSCGLVVGQTPSASLQAQVRKYGSDELRARLEEISDSGDFTSNVSDRSDAS
ncbi:hypothetical protein EUZ85_26940 [Hahella sp. KA22]|uniref:hypothetical protein n=1 Tax=Hahella sp. KA22 TaxID=1628392 RepID=UPI000FDD9A41|nr:hypothetical protein [Hahella sp. KA22]AZZ94158.1 hypothetical protein ENC22_24355 [Hahella sp. KA22]QAY57532.1 hypothetical protein EUZ85_26940 [Hahella sp. KA22]